MRVVRGRGHDFPFPDGGNARLEALPELNGDRVSFRLVHDNEERTRRGRAWPDTGDNEPSVHRYPYSAGFYDKFLGFRLTREDE
jgi:hypothetical protein